ncbi:MAG: hypothetical protein U1F43_17225 [Myxococcota bacterium]
MSDAPRIVSAGPGHAIWVAPRLFATSHWGPHEPGSQGSFFEAVDRAMAEVEAPFDYLADTFRLRLGDHDWRSVEAGFRWMRENRARLERLTRRSVVLASNTALGWAIVGAQKVMGLSYPTLVARSIDEAVAQLERPDAPALATFLAELPEVVRGRTSELVRLAELLERSPELALAAAARALGIGERSLQRLLSAHGTSFREERARVLRRAGSSRGPLA